MKRSSEDASRGTQLKRSTGSSRPEAYIQIQHGRPEVGRVNHHELTTTDALTYLQDVKEMFKDQQDKYEQFLGVMKDFKAQRTDTAGVIERVKELFKGHNNLIIGFNTFLPKGYEITLNEEELTQREDEVNTREDESQTRKTMEFQEAISFVNKIKKRFVQDDTVYKTFLDILNMYRKEQKGITEVYQEVSALLIDHRDLLEEFIRFLPPTPGTPSALNGIQKGNPTHRNYERNSDVHSLGDVPVPRKHDKIIGYHQTERASYHDMDADVSLVKKYKDQIRPAGNQGKERRSHDVNGEAEHDGTAYIKPQRQHDKRNSGLNSDYDRASLKSMYRFEFLFCQKVKERLMDPNKYQSFLKLFNIYSSNIVTHEEFQGLVTKSLGEHPDFMDEFNEILEHCENIDGFISGLMNIDSVGIDVPRSSKAENRDKEKMQEMPIPRMKDRHREDYLAKSIHELDLSNCQRCTPSYRHLPDDYPIPMASQRSKLGTEVLNDYWVSVTSGSEDYSFKFMRRNQYEEALFRCEDDRFELDLLIETTKSTILRIEELQHKIKDKSLIVDGPVHIEDHFTAIHLRCIERLYGDHCLDVLDFLRKRFTQSLHVIKTRLKQRKEEWSKSRSGFNNGWAQVYAKNHYNSLDHRSFYFKQQDSKNLSCESLLLEIKGLKEAMKKEGNFQMETIAGKIPIAPYMEFQYSDVELHGDLHRIVQFSCGEVCSTAEQSAKVMHFWSSFLAPIIGVAPELLSVDGTGSVLKSRKRDSQNRLTSADRSDGCNSLDCDTADIRGSAKGDNTVDKYNSSVLVYGAGNGTCSDTVHFGKEQHSFTVTCNALDFNGRGASEIKPVISDVQHSIGAESRVDIEVVSALSRPKRETNLDDITHTAVGDCTPAEGHNSTLIGESRNGSSAIGDDTKAGGYHLNSGEAIKIEKEEGELSPTGDSEDDLEPWSEPNDDKRSGNHATEEAVGENDTYAYDDAYMHDKAPESDSAGDECSGKEPDEEDVEHNGCESKVDDVNEAAGQKSLKLVNNDGAQLSMLERFLMTTKPLAKHVPPCSCAKEGKDTRVFYGNASFFVLFRLHQILYKRLLFAKKNSTDSDSAKTRSTPDCYSRFMDALYNLLDGTTDNEDFEDNCRALLGNHSYMLFTLDKLIYKLIKQLQTIVTDEVDIKLLQLYEYETSRKNVNYAESVYHENARVLAEDDEIFRFEFSSCPSRLSIQLLDGVEKPEAVAVALDPNFAGYLFDGFLSSHHGLREPLGVVLQRNKRTFCAGLDEVTALSTLLERFRISNRLECKIDCKSSKVSYVLGTEDVLFRIRRNRRDLSAIRSMNQSRAEQFRKLFPPPQYP